jgi:hypothetical protein
MGWGDIGLQLAQLLLPVIAALVAALIGVGIAYLRRQAEQIGNQVARDALQAALAEADRVAREAITSTAQTFVDDLKAGREDGKLTEEEARQAMERAKDYFLARTSRDSMLVLESALGPVEDWMEGYLESQIGAEKKYFGRARG